MIKFDLDPELELGKEEFAYSLMARMGGVDMPETRLLETEGGRFHFLVRRFDHAHAHPLHLHSYSGLTHTPVGESIDYGDMMNVTRELTGRESEVEKMFRRAVFNVASGNDDDHGRNHSFLMNGHGEWRLSPAYDLTQASNPLASGVRAATVLGKGINITRNDLARLGDSQGVRNVDGVISEVMDALGDWPRWARKAGLSRSRARDIGEDFTNLAG